MSVTSYQIDAAVRMTFMPLNISTNQVTTAFETVGHLAHMNLRDDDLPYKYFIGQVLSIVVVVRGLSAR